jgi:branched-chain amino acid transport system permease protein
VPWVSAAGGRVINLKKSNLALIFGVTVFLGIVIAESLNQAALTSDTFISAGIEALVVGSIYAIAASGLVVTYQTSGVFNFAQGAIGMFMAFLYWEVRFNHNWPAPIALIAVILVAAPLMGAGIERLLMRRIANATLVVKLVVTIGLMFLLLGATQMIWPDQSANTPPFPAFFAASHGVNIGNVVMTWHQIITIGVAIGIAVFLRLLLHNSRTGTAMRAVVDNRTLASLNGARPGRLSALSWAIGASMAATAGILLAPTAGLRIDVLTLFIIDAFAAAIIGRLKSLPWTFVGGLIIGASISFATNFLNLTSRWSTLSTAIPALVLFVALLALPQARIELGRLAPRHRVPRVGKVWETAVGMVALLAVVGLLIAFAGLQTTDTRNVAEMAVFACIALSFVPLTGWAGQVSLAQVTFVGVGAFAMSQVAGGAGDWFSPGSPLGLVAGALLAVPFGLLLALPALRLQGLYLALASLAFATMALPLFFNQPEIFGTQGPRIATLNLFGINFNNPDNFLVAATVIFALLAIFIVWLRRRAFGRRLVALRDSEAASATLGVNLIGTKLAVFALTAAIAGFAGGLLGMFQGTADTMSFQLLEVIGIGLFLLVVVGGVSTISGALFAGVAAELLLFVQDKWTLTIAGIAVFTALVRLGPGLASLGVGGAPEGATVEIGAAFARFLPWRHDAREAYQRSRTQKRDWRAARARQRSTTTATSTASESPSAPRVTSPPSEPAGREAP